MTADADRISPTGITHDRSKRQLQITWRDGHETVYDLDVLREICPCVTCRGGHEFMGQEHDPDVLSLESVRSYELQKIELAGNYAVQLWWDDGHNTGIYTWEYLRRMDSA